MATAIMYNDFRYGMVSEYMRRRTDLSLYQKSASLIENAVPMRTGGVRLRPGLSRMAGLDGMKPVRILPFVVSVREHYILFLCPKVLFIYSLGLSGAYENVSGDGYPIPYTESEIREVQAAHSSRTTVLVQRNHPPIAVQLGDAGGWSVGTISLDAATDAYSYSYDDEGNETKAALSYSYNGLFTENNFPSVAAFNANRLWLGASTEHPYRIWASKPFEYFNFQIEEWYNYADESVTASQFMDAISGAGERSDVLKAPADEETPGEIWIVTKTVDAATGVVVSTNAIYEYFYNGSTGRVLGHRVYDEETDTWGNPVYDGTEWRYTTKYTKTVYKLDSIPTESSALQLDMASDRDETISWLASNGSLIFVGTATSEWAMSSSITALSPTNSHLVTFGSAPFIQAVYGGRSIFYIQSGGKLLRSIYSSDDGTAFLDLTYQCSDVLSPGVMEMAWQRVPEPRLYCVLKDGTMAVLCYDADYDINAWCVWKSGLKIKSIAVIDTEDGQEVFAIAEDSDGNTRLYRFESGVFTDDSGHQFIAKVRTNNLDSTDVMLYTKKSLRVAADSMRTRFRARMNDTPLTASFSYDSDLITLWNWTRPTNKGLRAEFESYPGEDMILLAVIVETEVSD